MPGSPTSGWRASWGVVGTRNDGTGMSWPANGGACGITARRVGITREGLYKKMKRLNVE